MDLANKPTLITRRTCVGGILATPFVAWGLAQTAAHAQPDSPVNTKERFMSDLSIQRVGSQSSVTDPPADWFTGNVRLDPLASPKDPSSVSISSVTFEPGARTKWHTHPRGQHLIITSGAGWVQQEGGAIEEVRPGDLVWFPPGLKHWHGAAPETAMTHLAIQEAVDGSAVEWLEAVTDAQYAK